MENLNDLMELTKEYLLSELQKPSIIDIIVQYIVPCLGVIVLLGTAIAGVIKYYKTKNAEINELILKEVYTPLYGYFVRQELYRKIHKMEDTIEEAPVLEVTSTKTTCRGSKVEKKVEAFCDLNRDSILKMLNSVNTGLASKELFTLLQMYSVLVEMENKYDQNTNEYLEATILKVEVEKALKLEILKGYKYYYSKLGLKSSSKSGLWVLNKNGIEFPYDITEEEKLVLKKVINADPERYSRL